MDQNWSQNDGNLVEMLPKMSKTRKIGSEIGGKSTANPQQNDHPNKNKNNNKNNSNNNNNNNNRRAITCFLVAFQSCGWSSLSCLSPPQRPPFILGPPRAVRCRHGNRFHSSSSSSSSSSCSSFVFHFDVKADLVNHIRLLLPVNNRPDLTN